MKAENMFKRIEEVGLDYIFDFGKYKGIPVITVVDIDPSYLFWAEEHVSFFLMDSELYNESVTSFANRMVLKRFEKKALIRSTNDKIESLSQEQRNRNRRNFWKRKK